MKSLLRRLLSFYGISLTVIVGTTVLFVLLADNVLSGRMLSLNRQIMLAIHAKATPTLDSVALLVTWLGSFLGITIVSVIFAVLLLRRKDIVALVAFAMAVLGSVALMHALKAIFAVTRPELFPRLEEVSSYSFPSGHTLTSFCMWGFMAFWLLRMRQRETWRWIVASLFLLIAALVGASRVYIGVHWPTDVLGGILLATVWVINCLIGMEGAGRIRNEELRSNRRSQLGMRN